MNLRRLRGSAGRWAPVIALLGFAVAAAPGGSQAASTGELSFTPKNFSTHSYIGGQLLTYSGKLPSTGKRQTIWLELNMNRPADTWWRFPAPTWKTRPNGSFSFSFPARSMREIRMRVRSAKYVTSSVRMRVELRDITLAVQTPSEPGLAEEVQARWGEFDDFVRYPAVAGEEHTIVVDTAPGDLPVFPGIKITLQKRTGTTWKNLAVGYGDQDGVAEFPVTWNQANTVVYRALTGTYTGQGERIPWFPSFPTYVDYFNRASLPTEVP